MFEAAEHLKKYRIATNQCGCWNSAVTGRGALKYPLSTIKKIIQKYPLTNLKYMI